MPDSPTKFPEAEKREGGRNENSPVWKCNVVRFARVHRCHRRVQPQSGGQAARSPARGEPARAAHHNAGRLANEYRPRPVRELALVGDQCDFRQRDARAWQRGGARQLRRHAAPIHYLHRDSNRPGRFSHRQHSCDGHGGLGGCAASVGPSVEEMFTREVQDAFFDYDKADIRGDARQALSKTADFLRSYPQVAIVIEGHCDERGSTEYNVALGDRRADSAKNFLTAQGIAGDRIQTVSYGKERPFCTESNESCWQQNRRAHFRMGGTSSSQLNATRSVREGRAVEARQARRCSSRGLSPSAARLGDCGRNRLLIQHERDGEAVVTLAADGIHGRGRSAR